MEKDNIKRAENEIKHSLFLAQGDPEKAWGWGTPAGQHRAKRRAELIIKTAGLKPGMRVLEIGCGTGMFSEMFAASGIQLVAVDISPDLLKKARQRCLPKDQVIFKEARFEDCDIDGPFDAVIGSSVLHHLKIEAALSKIYELLKPGGCLCFSEPNALNPQVVLMFNLRFLFPYQSPDENPFLRWKLLKKMKNTGFAELSVKPYEWLHPRTPEFLIETIKKVGYGVEKIPLIKEFAASLLISARRPITERQGD